MAYTKYNYKTKKDLLMDFRSGFEIQVYQPGLFGPLVPDGFVALEGPHYPEPHRWYAQAVVENGLLVKVK